MQYTEEQKSAFKREFGVRRKRQIILWFLGGPLVLAYAFLDHDRASAALGLPRIDVDLAGYVLIAGGVLFSLWNWRCPACNLYLAKGINWASCPKCRVVLQ